MSTSRINFTSAILSDMTAKAAAFQVNKQPQQAVSVENKQQAVTKIPVAETNDTPGNKNKTKRNTIIGLGAAAVLISLGIAGRKGKLGPKIQKFMGGAEKTATKNTDEISSIGTSSIEHSNPTEVRTTTEHTLSNIDEQIHVPQSTEITHLEEPIPVPKKPETKPVEESINTAKSPRITEAEKISKPLEESLSEGTREVKTMQIEPANTDAAIAKLKWWQRREIAKINSIIDREIPVIDESLKTLKMPTKEEAMAIVKKEIDLKSVDISKGTKQPNGTIRCIETRGNYEYTIDFNPDETVQYFCKTNKAKRGTNSLELNIIFKDGDVVEYQDFIQEVIISKSNTYKYATKDISKKHTIWYNSDGRIEHCSTYVLTSYGGITTYKGTIVYSSRMEYVGGKISHINYYSPKTGELLKTEHLDDTGKIIKETYRIGKKDIVVEI